MYKIRLKVENEDELYNSFDPLEDRISEDVKLYIADRISRKSIGQDIELHIISEEPIDEDRFHNALQGWISEEKAGIIADRRKNTIQQLWLLSIGVVFIAISAMLESQVSVIWFTVLSTIGAFSVWEAANIWIVENPKLRLRKRMIRRIGNQVQIKIDI